MINTSDAVIAVVSGAFPNTLERTLEVVRAVSAGNGPVPEAWVPFHPDPGSITIIGAPEHRAAQSAFATASWKFVNSRGEAPALVAQLLQGLAGTEKRVLVLAFNAQIFNMAKAVWPGIQVQAQHFFTEERRVSTVRCFPAGLSIGALEPPWMFRHLSTLEEALTTLTNVLELKGAVSSDKPVRQTSLRPLMGRLSPAKFFGSAASTNSNGMIGTLLRIAEMRGLVQLAGEPGDYLVWLCRSGARSNPHPQPESAEHNDLRTRTGLSRPSKNHCRRATLTLPRLLKSAGTDNPRSTAQIYTRTTSETQEWARSL